jgi:hypothetical protein
MIVVLIVSASPPYSQSLSARFGKPVDPRASDAWHWLQWFRKSFCPTAFASGLTASVARSIAASFA